MKLRGKNGRLRIYDASAILHGQAPHHSAAVHMATFDGLSAWADITANVQADDALFHSAILADADHLVLVGSTQRFAAIRYLLDAGANYAAGAGALKAFYFNGTDFSTPVDGLSDGTALTGNTLARDGNISFKIPNGWALGADAVNAALDADKYYIALQVTAAPATAPDADVLCPVDGQFFEVAFAAMDFSGPLGRPDPEEILVLNRGNLDDKAHFIYGSDEKIHEPVAVSFSALLDDVHNRDAILSALACGNPASARWTAGGVTTKGTTSNNGTDPNPHFLDPAKKTVNIHMQFEGKTTIQGWACHEVYFPMDEQTVSEAEDGVTLSCNGGCYGVIERVHGFGNRYQEI